MNIIRIIVGSIFIALGILAFIFLHDGELWIIRWVFPILAIVIGLVFWAMAYYSKDAEACLKEYTERRPGIH